MVAHPLPTLRCSPVAGTLRGLCDPAAPSGRSVTYRAASRSGPAQTGACGRKCYTSVRAARDAHRQAGHKIRPYVCETCTGRGRPVYHAANSDRRS